MMPTLQTLVFPTDGSACAEAARPVAERLATLYGATLHTLRVRVVDDPRLRDDLSAEAADATADDDLRPPADGEAVRYATSATRGIVDFAGEVGAGLIVLGTHGRSGLERYALGSTAEGVLRRAACPVLTVAPQADVSAPGPVLVALSFDDAEAGELVAAAADLAARTGRGLVAVHVVEPLRVPVPYAMTVEPFDRGSVEARVRETLGWWTDSVEGVGVRIEVLHGDAAAEIVVCADALRASVVVQGTRARRGAARWLLGSVAEHVARQAPCPVLTIRTG